MFRSRAPDLLFPFNERSGPRAQSDPPRVMPLFARPSPPAPGRSPWARPVRPRFPSRAGQNPVRPCVPITIRSQPISSAVWTIPSGAYPRRSTVFDGVLEVRPSARFLAYSSASRSTRGSMSAAGVPSVRTSSIATCKIMSRAPRSRANPRATRSAASEWTEKSVGWRIDGNRPGRTWVLGRSHGQNRTWRTVHHGRGHASGQQPP